MQATHDRRMCKTRVACRPPPSTHVFADVSIGMLLGYFRLNFWALLLLSYCYNLLLLGWSVRTWWEIWWSIKKLLGTFPYLRITRFLVLSLSFLKNRKRESQRVNPRGAPWVPCRFFFFPSLQVFPFAWAKSTNSDEPYALHSFLFFFLLLFYTSTLA